MPAPEPNSPEALKAARKIKELFFAIAAMNLVLILVVMCTRKDPPPPAQPTPPPASAPAKQPTP
jgi:hypothetical protein